ELLHAFKAEWPIVDMVFLDERRLALAHDHHVCVWDVSGGAIADKVFVHFNRLIHCMATSADGRILAVAGEVEIQVLELPSKRMLMHVVHGIDAAAVWKVALSPDGKALALGMDNRVEVCHGQNYQQRWQYACVGRVSGIAFGADGLKLASTTVDGTI